MSWLTKIETIAVDVTKTLPILGPIESAVEIALGVNGKTASEIATVKHDATTVMDLVGVVAKVSAQRTAASKAGAPLSDAQLLAIGTSGVMNALLADGVLSQVKIADPVKFAKAMQGITQGVVDLADSLHPDSLPEK